MDDRLDEKYSRILEGMFRGITAKIKEAHAALEKEYRYGVSQQGFSHEALMGAIKEESAKLLTEIKYLAQQNIDIYDYSRKEHAAMQDALMQAMDERNTMLMKAMDEKIAAIAAPAHKQTNCILYIDGFPATSLRTIEYRRTTENTDMAHTNTKSCLSSFLIY